ncbi:hypothetical protein [Burkholderia vietnamiensis]|uniref:hypothetical protein n=1 Tax=Burkholderia vietnamiensis TaxID=60552 RepID=UPI001592C161|nr:hypothetical protein [Burkholderia vietnamiensis]
MKRYLFAVVSLAATVAHAMPLVDNPCGLPDPEQYVREPICTDLSCVPVKEARAKQVEAAAKCEFERAQYPGLGLAPPPAAALPAPAAAQ